ncbi:MAG: App1 family protein [Propionibacteriaceae bacterium]
MSERPFFAARIEERLNRLTEAALRLCGWRERVISYTGYGNTQRARVMGRIVLSPPGAEEIEHLLPESIQAFLNRRGWRNFFVSACVNAPYLIHVNGHTYPARSDRGGYIDIRIPHHGLEPGMQQITIETPQVSAALADVLIVGDDTEFGLISDVDDTILSTFLPRPLLAAWNSFVLTEEARTPVPGMASMYNQLLADNSGAPIFYLSTGSFDTVPFLHRFLHRNNYPAGPFLMTDWGPTNTGWFRSGMEHKARSVRQLANDFPQIKWLLVGDDGQHDLTIYGDFAQERPDAVCAIAIRQLSPSEHVLAHGSTDSQLPRQHFDSQVPKVHSADGHGLLALLRPFLPRSKKQ